MAQSESSKPATPSSGEAKPTTDIPAPRRTFTVEFWVGIFMMAALAAAGYLAVGLGGVELFQSDQYIVYAEFDNVSGLKNGATVEIAGVPVGDISRIDFKDPVAVVTLRINNNVRIRDDDIASIRTKGIIGDRYIKIARGGSEQYVVPGETITETESVVDLEDIIGKIVHSFESKDEDEEKKDGDDI